MLLKRRRSHFIYVLICLLATIILQKSLTEDHLAKNGPHRHEAIVTLLTGDTYLCGALVLGYSLRKYGATKDRDIFAFVLHGTLNNTQHINMLKQVGWAIVNVKTIPLPSLVHPRLEHVLVKLYAWNMTQYAIIAALDADIMITGSIEEPFQSMRVNLSIQILAVNDLYLTQLRFYKKWKDKYFNSGVLFFRPKAEHFENLVRHASDKSYYGMNAPQQNLLNTYYRDQWHQLPMIYNLPEYFPHEQSLYKEHWNNNTRIVHFAGINKPWHPDLKNGKHVMMISDTKRIWRHLFSEMVNEYRWTAEDFLHCDASKSSVPQFDVEMLVNRTASLTAKISRR